MFCELGGEFVDTYNEDIRKLGKELGVEMQNLTTEGGDELYFFKGVFHMPNDMIDPKKKTGAFVPIAKQIAKDAGKLTDKHDNWTAYARKLNALQNKIDMKQGFALTSLDDKDGEIMLGFDAPEARRRRASIR